MSGSICGGQHKSKTWTKEEISKHIRDPCIDCYCGIGFKKARKPQVIGDPV